MSNLTECDVKRLVAEVLEERARAGEDEHLAQIARLYAPRYRVARKTVKGVQFFVTETWWSPRDKAAHWRQGPALFLEIDHAENMIKALNAERTRAFASYCGKK